MLTMQAIYLAVRDARESGDRDWENVARAIGADPDDPQFKELVRAMKVSGYLKLREDSFSIGPTPLDDVMGRVIAARRPRPNLALPNQDRLKVGPRMRLWDDEQPTGSNYVRDVNGQLSCVVGVTKAGQPTVRVGVGISDEDKSNWSGANGGATVVLDAAGADAFARAVESVIDAAEAAAVPYQQAIKRGNAAQRELRRAEGPRIGADAAGRKNDAEWNLQRAVASKGSGYCDERMMSFVHTLEPNARTEYQVLEVQYREHLRPTGSPAEHQRAQQERERIRAQQASLMTELTVAQAQELLDLTRTGWQFRTRAARERIEQLWAVSGESQGYLDGGWLEALLADQRAELNIDRYQEEIDAIEAGAKPVSAEQHARIAAAWDEIRAADAEYLALAGNRIVTVEVPGQWGTIVLEADQGEEEEPHRYQAGVRPASWPDGKPWSVGQRTEPWQPTRAQLRELARSVRQQCDQARPTGWRPAPSGVPDVLSVVARRGVAGAAAGPVTPGDEKSDE